MIYDMHDVVIHNYICICNVELIFCANLNLMVVLENIFCMDRDMVEVIRLTKTHVSRTILKAIIASAACICI